MPRTLGRVYGFLAYVLVKLLTGKAQQIRWLMYVVEVLFGVSFLI
ncbi:MAG: hypothetical protein Q8P50_08770 [Bacillota bacterium]|nr:hypothetical protein [Bacillota bacterium]